VRIDEFWDLMDQARADAVEGGRLAIRVCDRCGSGRASDAAAPRTDRQTERFAMAAEAIHFAASQAYERRTGETEAFWDALDRLSAQVEDDEPRAGEPWSGRFGSPEDAARIPVQLPRLHEFFAATASSGQ
jgi:hypothetical protein